MCSTWNSASRFPSFSGSGARVSWWALLDRPVPIAGCINPSCHPRQLWVNRSWILTRRTHERIWPLMLAGFESSTNTDRIVRVFSVLYYRHATLNLCRSNLWIAVSFPYFLPRSTASISGCSDARFCCPGLVVGRHTSDIPRCVSLPPFYALRISAVYCDFLWASYECVHYLRSSPLHFDCMDPFLSNFCAFLYAPL